MNETRMRSIAKKVRFDIIKYSNKEMIFHFGGELSCVEILVYIFTQKMEELVKPCRSQFILSKGHACFSLYCLLYELGYLKSRELDSYKKIGTRLQGHPDMKKLKYLDFSSGSLGQGLSVGVGKALGMRIKGSSKQVFILLGDGEINEGQIWEAAMSASKYKLNNLNAIIDVNHQQVDGDTEEVMPLGDLVSKWESFGWKAIYVENGHNFEELDRAFQIESSKPKAYIINTIKGKGISFMEGKKEWHSNKLQGKLWELAIEEVNFYGED